VGAVAFRTGTDGSVETLVGPEAEALFATEPSGSVPRDLAKDAIVKELARLKERLPSIASEARRRADAHMASFERLRAAAGLKGGATKVEPRGETDILGLYIYLPGSVK
jgi:hypothetical protein